MSQYGYPQDAAGYGPGCGPHYGSGFSLVVVLFILLIIVGCGCLLGTVAT